MADLSGPGVPSPREELRRVVFSALHIHSWDPIEKIADKITEAIAPLIAARVAAIEQERDRLDDQCTRLAEWNSNQARLLKQTQAERDEARSDLADSQSSPAVISGDNIENPERVAAERTQAAADAWDEGFVSGSGHPQRIVNPYRETP